MGRGTSKLGSGGGGGNNPFTDSKVQKTVFHGTNNDFDTFDKQRIGENFALSEGGFFFTNDERQAGRYGDNVKEVYLDMKNPYIVESPGLVSPTDFYDSQDLGREASWEGADGVIVKGTGDYAGKEIYVVFEPEQIKIKKTKKSYRVGA